MSLLGIDPVPGRPDSGVLDDDLAGRKQTFGSRRHWGGSQTAPTHRQVNNPPHQYS
jgi:hypothetical protein